MSLSQRGVSFVSASGWDMVDFRCLRGKLGHVTLTLTFVGGALAN